MCVCVKWGMLESFWNHQGLPPQPTVQIPSEPEKSILLYLSIIEDVIGSMLGQENDGKNERAVYYLSKRLHDYEKKYTPIEKSFHACWVGKFH